MADSTTQKDPDLVNELCCPPVTTSLPNEDEAHAASMVFSALSDPTRLRLFSLIATMEEVCSCNLEGPLQRSQPTISHHTKILADAGLIQGERRGKWMWWSIVPQRLQEVRQLLGGF